MSMMHCEVAYQKFYKLEKIQENKGLVHNQMAGQQITIWDETLARVEECTYVGQTQPTKTKLRGQELDLERKLINALRRIEKKPAKYNVARHEASIMD